YRVEVDRAKADLRAGRAALARRRLANLVRRRPQDGDVAYHLGLSELALGRDDAAVAAWEHVADSAPEAGWVEGHRSGVAQSRGHLAEAEDLLRRAVDRPGAHAPSARWDLVKLLRIQGRDAEARHLLESGFASLPDRVDTLLRLSRLDAETYPVDGVRLYLE